MIGMFKKKGPGGTPLEQVQTYLQQMGYDIEPHGEQVAGQLLQSGSTPAEVAAQIVYTTMAYDLKHAGTTATASLRYRPVATGILEALAQYQAEGLMGEASYQQAYDYIIAVNAINEAQVKTIDKVLSDPLLGSERMARNTGKLQR